MFNHASKCSAVIGGMAVATMATVGHAATPAEPSDSSPFPNSNSGKGSLMGQTIAAIAEALAFAVLSLLLSPVTATASTLVFERGGVACSWSPAQTVFTSPGTGGDTCNVSLPKWDLAVGSGDGHVGTLTGVEVVANLMARQDLAAKNPTDAPVSMSYDFTLSWGLLFPAPTFGAADQTVYSNSDINSQSGSLIVYPTGGNYQDVDSANYSNLVQSNIPLRLVYSGNDVQPFIGTGTFTFQQFANYTINFSASDPALSVMYGVWPYNADYRVRYTFDCTSCEPSSPVPLPAAAWLLLSGLAGLSFMGRRKAPGAT